MTYLVHKNFFKKARNLLIISCLLNASFLLSQNTPNILCIVADDLGIDALHASDYGISLSSQPITPNIQSLKNDGISFLNTWATPQCTTTRASVISGKYGINSGVRNVPDNLEVTHQSIFTYINNNITTSYAKAAIGKWHISNPINTNHPQSHGADYYEGVISGTINDYYSWEKVDNNGQTIQVNEYVTKHLTDVASSWISSQTKPWFLWLAHIAPHTPFHQPPSGTYSQTDLSGNRGMYLAAIESLDYYIGELLNNMDQATRDNTVIIFIGDNGTPNGVARYFPSGHGKTSMYEGGLRVPMIISGKGVTRKGKLESGLAQVNDIYATTVELLGKDLQGGIYNSYSLADALTTENTITRPYIYSDYIDNGVEYWAIRNNTYKLIENENGGAEFYNVVNDLEENNNLIGLLTNDETEILNELKTEGAKIRNGWSCQDDILNGEETTIDACTNCPTDVLSSTNIGCCDTSSQPSIYYEYHENNLRKIYSNSYPNHDFCYKNTSSVPTQSYHELEMDLDPVISGTITNVINQNSGRPATTFGVALNGVMFAPGPALPFVFLNPTTNEYNWNWVFEPTNNQGAGSDKVSLDCASAHTSNSHGYHYHGEMFSYLENEITGITTATTVNEIIQIGWAADGFPILYKFGPDATGVIKALQPSYKLKEGERPGDGTTAPCGPYSGKYTNDYEYQEGLGDLDECNGKASNITLQTANGTETFEYFYVITSTFPQIPRCLVGNVNSTFANAQVTGTDADGDGFIAAIDCDDTNAAIHPNATEIPGNDIDENCDGSKVLNTKEYDYPSVNMLYNIHTSVVRLIKNNISSYTVKLYDVKGKEIMNFDNSPEFISIKNLPNGMYVLNIKSEIKNIKQTYKLVKK
ncbi:sulfatase-like hydrolase/transferase [Tenacibaculum sp. 190524A02b]|uniref:sulfatase-like hydrolase/transferase n=1 Tax=Tenacibaculum vairaonense TaxID=3137860 RepID=UPI0031FB637B